MKIKKLQIVLPILLCLAVGFIGSIFTVASIPTWYASLNKPFFSPPNFIFGPVWTILYILMGISLHLVWSNDIHKKAVKKAVIFFFLQLFLNFTWSIIFFGLRSPILALLNIIILWIVIIMTMKYFKPISKNAFILLIPYILWVSFATILNLAIVILNN